MRKNRKIFIFGFDGLPLNLARKLADEGVMPNLARLFKKSWWGDLESTIPPLTGPAWASFATGNNPGETGIFNFLQPKDDLDDLEIISSRDIKGRTFYEVLEEKKKKCILINLPCSYPSRIKKGVVISSFLAGEDFFYPKNLIEEIPELAEYKLSPDFVLDLNIKKGLNDILEIEKRRFACGQKLFQKDWDCFFYLVSGTDWAMHLAFDSLIEKGKTDQRVLKIFKKVDSYLGWYLKNLPKGATVLIMSDHGFTTYSKVFYINTWLAKKKLLTFGLNWDKNRKRALTEVLISKAKPRNFQRKILKKVALSFINSPFLYSILAILIRITSFIFPNLFPNHLLNIALQVDNQKTKACALPGCGGRFGLFINDKKRFKQGIVSQNDYQELKEEIYKGLTEVLNKKDVWFKEEIYQGKLMEKATDILYCPEDIFVSPAFSRRIFAEEKGNTHSRLGFFLVWNRKIKKRRKIKNLNIIDIAPTILNFMGISPPSTMIGKVLK